MSKYSFLISFIYLGTLVFSQSKSKDPLLIGTELYFETSYKTMYDYMTKDMGFTYKGIEESEGAYIVEFDNNKNDEGWNNLRIVFMDKELTKQYVNTFSLFQPYMTNEYKKALIESGYVGVKVNGSEKFITENYIYEFNTSSLSNRKVYSMWIFRKPSENKEQSNPYENRIKIDETNYLESDDYVTFTKDNKAVTGTIYQEYTNGQLFFEIEFKNGYKHGYSKEWDEKGILKYEFNYVDGKLDGIERRYYSNGQIYIENNTLNGKSDGIWRGWYSNGNMKYEKSFNNGKMNGKWKSWYENGQIEKVRNYKNNSLDGEFKMWHQNGTLWKHFFYSNDSPVSKKCWDENGNSKSCE
jgi:antitoxin component YwqK of YwqJK toxin-antitoxin module